MESKISIAIQTERITAYHWLVFVICFICDMFGGIVSTLMSVYLPVVANDLLGQVDKTEMGKVSAYINALYIFGWMFGGVFWGMLSDRLGRVRSLVLSICCYTIFTLLISVAISWQWIVVCRFISGFGVGGVLVISTTFISEIWRERSRAIAIGILSIAFPIGIFSAGLINFFIADWRQGFLTAFVPLILGIIASVVMRNRERKDVAGTQVAHTGKIKILLGDEHRKNLIVGSLTFGTMLIGLWAIFSWLPTWVQSLLGEVDGQRARGLSMMLLGGGGLIGGFFSGWVLNAMGFRRTMIMCFSGSLILSFLLFKVNTTFSTIIYVETACLALFFGVSQGALSSYVPQLFPKTIRGTATGFCFNIGRLVTATVVFFVGVLVTALGGYGNAIFSFSLIFLIGLIAVLFAKESSVNLTPVVDQTTD